MKNLMKKISDIPDVYDDFVSGVINYAKKEPSHVEILNDYLDNGRDLTTSEVVEFIIQQPDFHNFSATLKHTVG